jgi:hypothetical protein
LDQEVKKDLEKLREQAQSARVLTNLASLSGIAAIPFAFVGIFIGNTALAAAALCWLVSHFVGYITRMLQEEHKQAETRLYLAEAAAQLNRTRPSGSPFSHRVSLN